MRQKTKPTQIIDMHVGKKLRLLRASRGLTQENLSNRLGISYQQLHKYETGANSISASRLYELSKFLSVSPDVFFEGLDETAATPTHKVQDSDLLSRGEISFLKCISGVPEHKRSALLGFIRSMSDNNN